MSEQTYIQLPHQNKQDIDVEAIEKRIKQSAKRSGSEKLYAYNWLGDIRNIPSTHNVVEIRFKNTRKEYFINNLNLDLEVGDIVAVEAQPGHDIGVVSLLGELVQEQIKKNERKNDNFLKVYRKARPSDIEKWEEAKALEHKTMIKSRQIAKSLRLNMKIGDVEYQGDKTKAIFYYIADERVDFRELIKLLAEEFKIRIEMRQIGARQEAGRIGGIGPCGRDLCCSTFVTNFITVTTHAARVQEVSLNPQKLAGQCGKLKCCLNYEYASYTDARKNFPETNIPLEFANFRANHIKTDVYKETMWYVYRANDASHILELHVDQVNDIIAQNKKGIKPEKPDAKPESKADTSHEYGNVVGQDSLTRFDVEKRKKHKNRGGQNNPNTQRSNNPNRPNAPQKPQGGEQQPKATNGNPQQAKANTTTNQQQQAKKPNNTNNNRNRNRFQPKNKPNNAQ
jgi:cell fate regulator YaaT (PSP1 superfamily)